MAVHVKFPGFDKPKWFAVGATLMISDTNFIPNRGLLNIAVIGSGIAGMAAAWLLNQRHRITVYEQNNYIGGHSNTVDVPCAGHPTPVDTGFIVYNEQN